jgi:hypothetical protein
MFNGLNLSDNFSSKMMFFNPKKFFQSMGSEYLLRTDLEALRHFFLQIWDKPEVIKRFQKQFLKLNTKKNKLRVLWFRKIPCDLFLKSLKKGVFSASAIFVEDYLRNLTYWEKSKKQIRAQRTKIKQESLISFSDIKILKSTLWAFQNK